MTHTDRIALIRKLRAHVARLRRRRGTDADTIIRKLGRIAELQAQDQAVRS